MTSTTSAPSVGAAVYRLAQESITNAVRHARHATRIERRASPATPTASALTVQRRRRAASDADGPSSGYGLVGMTERAALLGGTLEAGPSPDRGWTVDAVLPRTARADDDPGARRRRPGSSSAPGSR